MASRIGKLRAVHLWSKPDSGLFRNLVFENEQFFVQASKSLTLVFDVPFWYAVYQRWHFDGPLTNCVCTSTWFNQWMGWLMETIDPPKKKGKLCQGSTSTPVWCTEWQHEETDTHLVVCNSQVVLCCTGSLPPSVNATKVALIIILLLFISPWFFAVYLI